MGYTSDEAFDDEQPVTQVRIGRAFDRGKYEVTQRQWEAVKGTNPSDNTGCAHCPVEQVSWHDAQDFTRRLNAIDGAGTYPFGERSGLGVRDAGGDVALRFYGRSEALFRSDAGSIDADASRSQERRVTMLRLSCKSMCNSKHPDIDRAISTNADFDRN